jgi:hypothetical protein
LLEAWANDESIPLVYSRKAVEESLDRIIWLMPDR